MPLSVEELLRGAEALQTVDVPLEVLRPASEDVDGDAAVDLIAELAELARQIETELTRARTLADATG